MRNLLAGIGLALLAFGSGWTLRGYNFCSTSNLSEKSPAPCTTSSPQLPTAVSEPMPGVITPTEQRAENAAQDGPADTKCDNDYVTHINGALAKLLARHTPPAPASPLAPVRKRICFLGLENASTEELGNFTGELVAAIDAWAIKSTAFALVSHRATREGMREARFRQDDLVFPAKRRQLLRIMESQETPFDCLLFATVTTRTTRSTSPACYALTFEIIDMTTDTQDKETATISKRHLARCETP
ncbi:MAG TPA: hypothetical protein VGE74_01400 [Gemmata sp.]